MKIYGGVERGPQFKEEEKQFYFLVNMYSSILGRLPMNLDLNYISWEANITVILLIFHSAAEDIIFGCEVNLSFPLDSFWYSYATCPCPRIIGVCIMFFVISITVIVVAIVLMSTSFL